MDMNINTSVNSSDDPFVTPINQNNQVNPTNPANPEAGIVTEPMTQYEDIPEQPVVESHMPELPRAEITPAVEKSGESVEKEKVFEQMQTAVEEIFEPETAPDVVPDPAPQTPVERVVNQTNVVSPFHPLETTDPLTSKADAEEELFIKEIEDHHSHAQPNT